MKKARFTETQILQVLKEVEGGGRHVKNVYRENGVSEASYYNWKAKYGGMESSDIKRMKEREEENRRLNMSDALSNGRRFRLFNVVDDFNRETLAIDVDLNIPAHRVVRILERLNAERGYPAFHYIQTK